MDWHIDLPWKIFYNAPILLTTQGLGNVPTSHKNSCVSFTKTHVLFSSKFLFSPLDGGLVTMWSVNLRMSHVKDSTLDYVPLTTRHDTSVEKIQLVMR